MQNTAQAGPPRPLPLRFALALVTLEVLALLAIGAFLLVEVVSGHADDPAGAAATTGFAWLFASLLGLAARALWRLRRWGRGPVVTWQVLQLAVGASQFAAAPLLGGAVAAVAALALVGALAPASVAATAGSDVRRPGAT